MNKCPACWNEFQGDKCTECGHVMPRVQIDSESRINRERTEQAHTEMARDWLIDKGIIKAGMSQQEKTLATRAYALNLLKKPIFKTGAA